MEEIKIIYEDEDLLVIDKPAGWVTTREKRSQISDVRYIEDWVGEKYPNDLPRKGIVHRLDKGTSGILVAAKNLTALKKVKENIKNRRVVKKYLALVVGDFPFKAEVKMPIKRTHYQFDKYAVHEEGKMAWTVFTLKDKYIKDGKRYSLIEADLKTGRTHQIRVHLNFLKWPIVGDAVYGGSTTASGLNRPFLHAYRMELEQPTTGEIIKLESKLPTDLIKGLKEYEKI